MIKAGITCCSNGLKRAYTHKMPELESVLIKSGFDFEYSNHIYEKENVFGGTVTERAAALMEFYKNDEIDVIFDISGGDIANGILPYLDYDVIAKTNKLFFGYSDLTTVINAIYAKTGKKSVLYNVRNLVHLERCGIRYEAEKIIGDRKEQSSLYDVKYNFIQGTMMQGVVVGGNIRCFLKLAGTQYMPDMNGKILLLESNSGTVAKMETYLCQMKQLGIFDKISGIILGTFTEMESELCIPSIDTLVKRIVSKEMPIAVTSEIGHGRDSKAILIGEKMHIKA